MPDIDIFDFYRYLLAIFVTVYVSIITMQWAWGWYLVLRGKERYISILRQYLILHALRMRFRAFWGDVLICLLLCVVFVLIWQLHGLAEQRIL